MAAHEPLVKHDHAESGSDRSFGLIVGGVLVVVAGYQFATESNWYLWTLIPGVILITLGLIASRVLHPLNVAWTRLGVLLGSIATPIVMFFVYVIAVVPVALLLRLAGKDLLRLKRVGEEGHSYWIDRSPPGPSAESLRDQF